MKLNYRMTTTSRLSTRSKALCVAAAMLFGGLASAADSKVITFGVVPQQSASKLAKSWGPILSHISAETGLQFQFQTAPSIPVFEERVASGDYDIAYMNPYHYTEFSKQPGYRAFAKAKNKSIKGIIVVHKDSDIDDLNDFDEQTMAFPAPAAFAASVLPRAHFSNNDIDVTPKYVSSHDSVYMAVARGLYVGGGGVKRTLSTVDPTIREQLKILWTTDPFTSHPLAAHPRLDDEQVAAITASLVKLEETDAGKALLKRLAWKGVEAAEDERWDDVRELGIELLSELVSE